MGLLVALNQVAKALLELQKLTKWVVVPIIHGEKFARLPTRMISFDWSLENAFLWIFTIINYVGLPLQGI